MLMVSSKFESVGSRNATGKSKIPTELVTIGGTGGKTGAFQRINDEYEPNSSQRGLAMQLFSVSVDAFQTKQMLLKTSFLLMLSWRPSTASPK